jgi:hypothetical protein
MINVCLGCRSGAADREGPHLVATKARHLRGPRELPPGCWPGPAPGPVFVMRRATASRTTARGRMLTRTGRPVPFAARCRAQSLLAGTDVLTRSRCPGRDARQEVVLRLRRSPSADAACWPLSRAGRSRRSRHMSAPPGPGGPSCCLKSSGVDLPAPTASILRRRDSPRGGPSSPDVRVDVVGSAGRQTSLAAERALARLWPHAAVLRREPPPSSEPASRWARPDGSKASQREARRLHPRSAVRVEDGRRRPRGPGRGAGRPPRRAPPAGWARTSPAARTRSRSSTRPGSPAISRPS